MIDDPLYVLTDKGRAALAELRSSDRRCMKCGAELRRKRHALRLEGKTHFEFRKYCDAKCAGHTPVSYKCLDTGEVKTLTDWGLLFAARRLKTSAHAARVNIIKSVRLGRPAYGLTFAKVQE